MPHFRGIHGAEAPGARSSVAAHPCHERRRQHLSRMACYSVVHQSTLLAGPEAVVLCCSLISEHASTGAFSNVHPRKPITSSPRSPDMPIRRNIPHCRSQAGVAEKKNRAPYRDCCRRARRACCAPGHAPRSLQGAVRDYAQHGASPRCCRCWQQPARAWTLMRLRRCRALHR